MYRKKQKKRIRIFAIVSFIAGLFLFLSFMEHRMIPPLKEISHIHCKTLANQIIDSSVSVILRDENLIDNSIFVSYSNNEGYTANTAFVNQICSKFSNEITKNLQAIPYERIAVPLGTITGFDIFANKGPSIPFTLLPLGKTDVNYQSEILSVGINQINYKIWIDISIEIKIVNPLYQENVTLERKIMLADIVYGGKVPDHYFQLKSSDEYLLTE